MSIVLNFVIFYIITLSMFILIHKWFHSLLFPRFSFCNIFNLKCICTFLSASFMIISLFSCIFLKIIFVSMRDCYLLLFFPVSQCSTSFQRMCLTHCYLLCPERIYFFTKESFVFYLLWNFSINLNIRSNYLRSIFDSPRLIF